MAVLGCCLLAHLQLSRQLSARLALLAVLLLWCLRLQKSWTVKITWTAGKSDSASVAQDEACFKRWHVWADAVSSAGSGYCVLKKSNGVVAGEDFFANVCPVCALVDLLKRSLRLSAFRRSAIWRQSGSRIWRKLWLAAQLTTVVAKAPGCSSTRQAPGPSSPFTRLSNSIRIGQCYPLQYLKHQLSRLSKVVHLPACSGRSYATLENPKHTTNKLPDGASVDPVHVELQSGKDCFGDSCVSPATSRP